MKGAQRATLLWGKPVAEVLTSHGCEEVLSFPMVYRNREHDFEVAVNARGRIRD